MDFHAFGWPTARSLQRVGYSTHAPKVITRLVASEAFSALFSLTLYFFVSHLTQQQHNPACAQPFPDHTIVLIAIPTTSGSCSEVTSYAIISDPQNGRKYPLIAEELVPDYAILDPHLVLSVPLQVAVDTGMDVLTHAIEALVSSGANDFSDALAEKAIALTWQYLHDIFQDEKDIQARAHMHNASCMAGMAFNSAGLGLVHGMAHAIGGMLYIPHGKINAMLLSLVIDWNARHAPHALPRYLKCAAIMGIQTGTQKHTLNALINRIRKINQRFGIPVT
ncbi:iron-containing alcohol dehydrogenase [Sodalis glossinidius]|uniref:iron-containing alcohol dehydrogenase n=1 Tax=Sodalis glossinidius TaxID=63612 RepID=UPI0002E6E120|nr:iron-containing alcohol dehydrogenase [Sodalis glossinidius]